MKNYIKPEAEIIRLDVQQIIATSGISMGGEVTYPLKSIFDNQDDIDLEW